MAQYGLSHSTKNRKDVDFMLFKTKKHLVEPVYDIPTAAKYLGIGASTLYRYVANGKIKARKKLVLTANQVKKLNDLLHCSK